MHVKKLLLLMILAPGSALAAPSPYPLDCASLEQLKAGTKHCYDNELTLEAGVLCVNKMDALVKEKTKKLKEALAALQTGNHAQSQKMGEALMSYEAQEAELLRLLETTKVATRNIRGYLDNLVFPDHWDHEQEIQDYGAFFNAHSCFAEPREILFQTLEDVVVMKADLNDTLELARAMKQKSASRKTGLGENGSMTSKVTGGKSSAGAPARVPAGKQPVKRSTITGVEQDKAKRKQK